MQYPGWRSRTSGNNYRHARSPRAGGLRTAPARINPGLATPQEGAMLKRVPLVAGSYAAVLGLCLCHAAVCPAQEKKPQRDTVEIRAGAVSGALLKSPDGRLMVKAKGSGAWVCDAATSEPISRELEHGRCWHDER